MGTDSVKATQGDIDVATITVDSIFRDKEIFSDPVVVEAKQQLVTFLANQNAWMRHCAAMLHPKPNNNAEEHF